ncbi:MAG TPA: hypothetical protein ENI49_00010, partial [Thermoplasmatales archaeon]|nr:hypothetical protein [Thermoplasmatales archaeon]
MKRARYASIFIVEAILLASSLSTATLYNPIRDIDKVTQYFETSLSNSEDMIKEIELSKILGTPLFKGFSTIEKKSNIISEDIDNIFNSYIFDGGALDRILGLVTKELKSAKNSLYDTDSLDYAPTGLIIKFKQGGTNEKFVFHGIKEKISKLLPSTTDFSIEPVFKDNSLPLTNTFKIIFPESIEDPEKIITAFKNNPAIEYIEPDYVYMLTSTYPNDPYFSYQWALNQSNDHDIDAPEAWDYERGNGSITVAVIDTGVDYYHPDLSSNIWINTNETPGNGVDDDGNGYVDDVRGWNFVTNDNLPFDDSGHGTHCAGIIGAVGNNGIGVSGVCWNCSIMPVKCFIGVGTTGIGFASTIARGIVYAADNGADVISMSFGAYADYQLIKDAIEHAYNKGVVLVAAAGNDDTLLRMYPAAYPEVIAVAATNQTDGRAYFSNWGSWIDVAAPGDGIYSTASYTNYGYKDGTSMACAYASGLAALIKSQNDSLSNEAIRTLLRSGAESVSSNSYKYIGVGRINANDSLHMIADVVARLDDGLDDSIVSGNVTIFGTASGNNFSSYTVYYGSGIYPSSWNIISSSSSPVENGVLAIWNTLSLPDGTYTIKLSVAGDNSYSYTAFAVLTLNNYASKLHVGGSGAGNFSSIQEAIYNAGYGDTIYVHPGMYSESIVVDRSVTIVGEDRDSTIVTQSFSTSFPPLPTFYVSH